MAHNNESFDDEEMWSSGYSISSACVAKILASPDATLHTLANKVFRCCPSLFNDLFVSGLYFDRSVSLSSLPSSHMPRLEESRRLL